jgi:hypothetical protein
MKSPSQIPPDAFRGRYTLPTEDFAAELLVKPQTVLKQYSATGAYCGIRPIKLASRKLLWPNDVIEHLANQQLGGTA